MTPSSIGSYEADPEVVAAREAKMAAEYREREAVAWQLILERSGIPPRYQRAHLATNCAEYANDDAKKRAHEAARDLANTGRVTSRGAERFALLLTGPYGTGKTWLATGAFKAILARTPSKAGLWRKFYGFVRDVQATYARGSEKSSDEVIGQFQRAKVLLLDDVGDLNAPGETEDRRRLLYEVLDYRNDHLLPTILTTNLTGDAIAQQFGERTMQRVLEMCAMVAMEGRDYRGDPTGLVAPGTGITGPLAKQESEDASATSADLHTGPGPAMGQWS